MRRRCLASVGVTIATQPRSEAAMINFLELRYGEVRRIPIPRNRVNKTSDESRAFSSEVLLPARLRTQS
jgi:hypothetical protein